MRILSSRLIYLVASITVTVTVFLWLFSHITLKQVAQIITGANLHAIAMFIVLSLSMSFLRTWRYRLILDISGQHTGKVALFLVVVVRNMFADLLPARIGSIVYIYIVNRRLGIPFGAATSSFAVAFIFDFIAIGPLMAIAALFSTAFAGLSTSTLAFIAVVITSVSIAILVLLPNMVRFARLLLERQTLISGDRRQQWVQALTETETEIARVRAARIYDRIVVLSILVRITKYASLYVFLYALLEPLGYTLEQLDPSRVFLGLLSAEAAASLPISGIAGFGAYEGAWAATFSLLGFPAETASLTAVSHHLFTQLWGYSLGAMALIALLLPVFGKPATSSEHFASASPGSFFYPRLIVVCCLTGLLLWLLA